MAADERQIFTPEQLLALLNVRPFSSGRWRLAMTANVHLRIASEPVVMPRSAALVELESLLCVCERIGSAFYEGYRMREMVVVEADLTFRDAAGRLQSLPFVSIARAPKSRVSDLRFYLDPTPLPRFRRP